MANIDTHEIAHFGDTRPGFLSTALFTIRKAFALSDTARMAAINGATGAELHELLVKRLRDDV